MSFSERMEADAECKQAYSQAHHKRTGKRKGKTSHLEGQIEVQVLKVGDHYHVYLACLEFGVEKVDCWSFENNNIKNMR